MIRIVKFNSKTPIKIIKQIKPDIIVKGSDYKKKNIVGNKISNVKIFKLLKGFSSTNLIKKSEFKI